MNQSPTSPKIWAVLFDEKSGECVGILDKLFFKLEDAEKYIELEQDAYRYLSFYVEEYVIE